MLKNYNKVVLILLGIVGGNYNLRIKTMEEEALYNQQNVPTPPTSQQQAQIANALNTDLAQLGAQLGIEYKGLMEAIEKLKNTPKYQKLTDVQKETAIEQTLWQKRPSLEAYCYYRFNDGMGFDEDKDNFMRFMDYMVENRALPRFQSSVFEKALVAIKPKKGKPLSLVEQANYFGSFVLEGAIKGAVLGAVGGVAAAAAVQGSSPSAEAGEVIKKAAPIGAGLGLITGAYGGYKQARGIVENTEQPSWREYLKSYFIRTRRKGTI